MKNDGAHKMKVGVDMVAQAVTALHLFLSKVKQI